MRPAEPLAGTQARGSDASALCSRYRGPPGGQVTAIDHDEEMLRVARGRFGSTLGRAPRWSEPRPHDCRLPDESVDGITAVSVIGWLDNGAAFLREARRVLRPPAT
jgi:ubiquinone/menaquinone biosynthesis C-methylase UbiE